MPHLASPPKLASPRLLNAGVARRLVNIEPSTYGLMSMLAPRRGVSSPVRVASLESLLRPRRPHERGTTFRYEISFFQRTMRRKLTPQVVLPSRNRIERNGIRISIVHPPSMSAACDHHRPFQLGLGCSLVAAQSNIPPSRLAAKPKPLRPSLKVSKMTARWSLLKELNESRRISLATRRVGSLSCRRAPM